MADYTIKRLEEVDDVLGDYPGEMRMMTTALEAEQVAFTFRRMPQHTGGKGSYGHRHKTQEEIYFVLSGKLQFKLGDDVFDLEQGTVVCVAPETWRSVWDDEPEEAELIIVSSGSKGDPLRTPRSGELLARIGRARIGAPHPNGHDSTSATGRSHCSWKAGPRGPAPLTIGSFPGRCT